MGERILEMAGGGQLVLEQMGPRVRLEARRRADGRGLYTVWLRGGGEGRRGAGRGALCIAGRDAPQG